MNPLKTFFYSLKKSLFDPKYYQDVAKASFGFSFKYLLCLLFILTFIRILSFTGIYLKKQPLIQPEINKIMIYAENFYPKDLKLKIQNGQLSTNVKEPFIFDLEKKVDEQHLLIIDTKGSIENYPQYNTYVLATKNAVVYPSKSKDNKVGETSVFYFKELKQNFTLDKKTYDSFLNIAKPYSSKVGLIISYMILSFSPFLLIFGSFFWTICIMFGLVFLTFFIWVVNLIIKKGYGYGSLYKMGMHAITLPILVNEISSYLRSPYPTFYSWIFLIWMLVILLSTKKRG